MATCFDFFDHFSHGRMRWTDSNVDRRFDRLVYDVFAWCQHHPIEANVSQRPFDQNSRNDDFLLNLPRPEDFKATRQSGWSENQTVFSFRNANDGASHSGYWSSLRLTSTENLEIKKREKKWKFCCSGRPCDKVFVVTCGQSPSSTSTSRRRPLTGPWIVGMRRTNKGNGGRRR